MLPFIEDSMERRPIDDFVGKSVDGILWTNSIQEPQVFKGYSGTSIADFRWP